MLQKSRLCIYSYLLFPRRVAVKSSEPSMQAAGLAEKPYIRNLGNHISVGTLVSFPNLLRGSHRHWCLPPYGGLARR